MKKPAPAPAPEVSLHPVCRELHPGWDGPALCTKFLTEDADFSLQKFMAVEACTLRIAPGTKKKWTEISLEADYPQSEESEFCDTAELRFTFLTKDAEIFYEKVRAKRFFIWMLSTPTFEGIALVDPDTSKVQRKRVTQRTLN